MTKAKKEAKIEKLDADLLARKYKPALLRFFRRRARQPADVDDLVQEVLLRICVRGEGPVIEQPEFYMMRTATNVWRDYLRKKKTHARDAHDEYSEEQHASEDYGPRDVMEADRSIEDVLAVLQQMSPRTRQVFVLCRVEGLRQKAVAQRLGVSVSSIEKHMIKAIAHLARNLGREKSNEDRR